MIFDQKIPHQTPNPEFDISQKLGFIDPRNRGLDGVFVVQSRDLDRCTVEDVLRLERRWYYSGSLVPYNSEEAIRIDNVPEGSLKPLMN